MIYFYTAVGVCCAFLTGISSVIFMCMELPVNDIHTRYAIAEFAAMLFYVVGMMFAHGNQGKQLHPFYFCASIICLLWSLLGGLDAVYMASVGGRFWVFFYLGLAVFTWAIGSGMRLNFNLSSPINLQKKGK